MTGRSSSWRLSTRSAGDLSPYSVCDGVEFGGRALTLQHDLGHPEPGSVCFTPNEIATFLTYAIDTYDVDPQRVYLTGLSCGGFGAWEYLSTYGDDQVAAVVPIAGEGRPAWATAGARWVPSRSGPSMGWWTRS